MSDVFFSWQDLARICAGHWLLPPSAACAGVNGVEDNSRALYPGALFVAIAGEVTDGHRHLLAAIEAGATALCVQRELSAQEAAAATAAGCGCLRVADSLLAFQALARAHRLRFPDLALLGITGSCGKTSSKELCAAVLEQRWPGRILKTLGNTNNHFGVPRNLLRIERRTAAAVIEMGSNHPGEIATLAAMALPQHGLICSIGAAHLEFFHDLRGVAEEKGDLLSLCAADGVAIIPAEAVGGDVLRGHAAARRVLTFGTTAAADMRCDYLGQQQNGYGLALTWRDTGERIELSWSIGGEHQARNAAGAALVGKLYGLSLAEIARGLQQATLPDARMAEYERQGIHWVNDAYNASPDSMRASITWFAEISRDVDKRILILGDMRELGEHSAAAHHELLRWLRDRMPGARVITVGEQIAAAADAFALEHYPDSASAKAALSGHIPKGSWVFLKASNSIQLDDILPES
jgi:UDP-N-acetylmuramoyl-tripeptide--D-alanyl-D-alanine ligase